ncbi:type IV pilin protein [Iodobacter sp. CM08]|uniref:type IV pilin protein n=1 Tax=Iodobacter sp. CM08 TaxID=3085902 RepID=UPI002982574D|nr:type IV pilin protein [Iodobacter sp. CM08]MDW5417899.1 type IV pilin protein [Iodobacter sp. CM08]
MNNQQGFTLIEVMITVAIIGILASIAVPQYSDYVTRSRLVESQSKLSDTRVRLEQFFVNNRTYMGFACDQAAAGSDNFTISCPTLTATTFTISATGASLTGAKKMIGFGFTLDDLNQKTSAITGANASSGWSNPTTNNCWVSKKPNIC